MLENTWLLPVYFLSKVILAYTATDIVFVIEIVQYAKKHAFDRQVIWKQIPRTIEACLYNIMSTCLVFYYIGTPNAQVARLLRNLTAKSTEVACFLYLYYATIKEMQEQVVNPGRMEMAMADSSPLIDNPAV
jgi:hypothetical protein